MDILKFYDKLLYGFTLPISTSREIIKLLQQDGLLPANYEFCSACNVLFDKDQPGHFFDEEIQKWFCKKCYDGKIKYHSKRKYYFKKQQTKGL